MYIYGTSPDKGFTVYTGMSCELLFDSFRPHFDSFISTTVDRSVAHRFSGGNGMILKLRSTQLSWHRYFDVEFLSNFPEERERLFFMTWHMMIADIITFNQMRSISNALYVSALSLFSSIFAKDPVFYIKSVLSKNKNKIQKCLIGLI